MLRIEECLLIILDAQGNLARVVAESETAINRIQILTRAASCLGLPLLLTAQAPHKIGHTIEEVTSLLPGQPELARSSFSILADAGCRQAIAACGRKQLLLCGFETHICIYQSAAEMLAEGREVYIAADAVSSRRLSDKQTALYEISALGGHVLSTEMALFSLLRDASTLLQSYFGVGEVSFKLQAPELGGKARLFFITLTDLERVRIDTISIIIP